jgi:hypothetical protein
VEQSAVTIEKGSSEVTITRKDVRRQVRSGWCTRQVAALLLGFDLDVSMVDDVVARGIAATKTIDGEQRLSVHDVLSVAGSDLRAILDKRIPIDRHKRSIPRNASKVRKSQTACDCFHRQLHRLQRHVAKLVASSEEDLTHRELKLITALLEASRFYARFDVVHTSARLQKATGLDDEYLPKARRGLERRGLLDSKPADTVWKMTLLDPKTRKPFEDCATDKDTVDIIPAHDWDSWEDC